MDKEWIKKEAIAYGLAMELPEIMGAVESFAEAIAQAAEEERRQQIDADAQVLATTIKNKDEAIVGLRAQVEEALTLADSWEEYDEEWGEIDPGRCYCADNLRKALSAAPKVARLKMRLRREPMGDRYLETTGQDSYLAMGTLRYDETYDVLVMVGEQGQESEHEVPD